MYIENQEPNSGFIGVLSRKVPPQLPELCPTGLLRHRHTEEVGGGVAAGLPTGVGMFTLTADLPHAVREEHTQWPLKIMRPAQFLK